MDLSQLRKQAKELKAAFLAGDPATRERVLASHPNFAGRPAERLANHRFVLRDAQATVAREQGFTGWTELLAAASPVHPVTPAWARVSPLLERAYAQARARGDRVASVTHVVLALLDPPEPTVARQVLLTVGVDTARLPVVDGDGTSVSSSIPLHEVERFARGLALAAGRIEPTDEEMLLALVYQHAGGSSSTLSEIDVDPHEVYDELAARGVTVPAVPPPLPRLHGPWGPVVYVPLDQRDAVSRRRMLHHPPGTRRWGINSDRTKPGMARFIAEDDVDLPTLARQAVDDPSLVEVVPVTEAMGRGSRAGRPSTP